MENLQDVFNRIQEQAKEQRVMKEAYRESLESNTEYQELVEKLQGLKDRKKQIEFMVSEQLADQMEKIERIQKAIASDKQILADIALSTYVKGEQVEVVGPKNEPYEPQFSVRFKKKP